MPHTGPPSELDALNPLKGMGSIPPLPGSDGGLQPPLVMPGEQPPAVPAVEDSLEEDPQDDVLGNYAASLTPSRVTTNMWSGGKAMHDDLLSNFTAGESPKPKPKPKRDNVVDNFVADLEPAERAAALQKVGPAPRPENYAFDEAKHDRAADGKFAPKGQGGEKAPDEDAEKLKKAGRKSYPTEGEAKRAVDESKAEVDDLEKKLSDLESKKEALGGDKKEKAKGEGIAKNPHDLDTDRKNYFKWRADYLSQSDLQQAEIDDMLDAEGFNFPDGGGEFGENHVGDIKKVIGDAAHGTLSDEEIEEIAKEHVGVETLQVRGMDSLDFPDVGRTGMTHAIRAADVERAKRQKSDDDISHQDTPAPDDVDDDSPELSKGGAEAARLIASWTNHEGAVETESDAQALIDEAMQKLDSGDVPGPLSETLQDQIETLETHLSLAKQKRQKQEVEQLKSDRAARKQAKRDEREGIAHQDTPAPDDVMDDGDEEGPSLASLDDGELQTMIDGLKSKKGSGATTRAMKQFGWSVGYEKQPSGRYQKGYEGPDGDFLPVADARKIILNILQSEQSSRNQ